MPTMASITVKKADGTTDIIYAAATPAAGDRSPAVWRPTVLANFGWRPKFSMVTRDNQKQNGRIFQFNYNYPVIDSVAGTDQVVANIPISLSGTLPTNVVATEWEEAFEQFGNLLVSALIRAAVAEGYSPS